MRFFLLIIVLFFNTVYAFEYSVYKPESYEFNSVSNDKILFILDFSNSMLEYLDGQRKIDILLDTMNKLLSNVPPNVAIGLRVYGHKGGFSAFDACRASTLMVPIGTNNSFKVNETLNRINPRGMTPITYSLKQAVKNDFLGFSGKKRIILLTDGGENCDESPCDYVMELIKVRKDVCIDVIALNINDEDDLAQLECTALVTSGKFYTAQTAAELANSLRKSLNAKKEVNAKIFIDN